MRLNGNAKRSVNFHTPEAKAHQDEYFRRFFHDASALTFPCQPLGGLKLPGFDGHGNSNEKREPDGSKKETHSLSRGVSTPGGGNGDPQRQDAGPSGARTGISTLNVVKPSEPIRNHAHINQFFRVHFFGGTTNRGDAGGTYELRQ